MVIKSKGIFFHASVCKKLLPDLWNNKDESQPFKLQEIKFVFDAKTG